MDWQAATTSNPWLFLHPQQVFEESVQSVRRRFSVDRVGGFATRGSNVPHIVLAARIDELLRKVPEFDELAGRQGFEPRYRGPEPRVLPLDDLPVTVRRAGRARTFDYSRSKERPASARQLLLGRFSRLLTRDVVHRAALAGVARVAAFGARLVAAALLLLLSASALAQAPEGLNKLDLVLQDVAKQRAAGTTSATGKRRVIVRAKPGSRHAVKQSLLDRANALFGEALSQHHLLYDPINSAGSREYVPGDPVRHIHWKATAKRQHHQVKDARVNTIR